MIDYQTLLLTGKTTMKNNDKDKIDDNDAKKTNMKKLRVQRKTLIAAASSKMKTQKKDIKAIKEFLNSQASTIPDIADGIDLPQDKTLWYIATMKKYGQIVEDQKQGAFFKYALNEPVNNEKKTEV